MSALSDTRGRSHVSPAAALREMTDGFRRTSLVYVAAKLGIADMLGDGPRTAPELARQAGADSRALHRVLRALASLGIFAEDRNGRFELTPLADPLQSGVPGSLRAWAIMSGEEWQRSWGELLYTVRTGRPAFEHLFGMGYWEYLAANPEVAHTFNESMAEATGQAVAAIVDGYDFSGISTIIDVGGGHGSLITAILEANPRLKGVLFDQPSVIEAARSGVARGQAGGRCELVAGDFFESVPKGGDAHILKWIIHDWDDDRAVAILKSCRRALAPGGRVLLVERVIPAGNEPFEGKLGDIMMLVLGNGLERNEVEYRALLAASGFALAGVFPTASPFSIVEGIPHAPMASGHPEE